jgi:hypothetical protein
MPSRDTLALGNNELIVFARGEAYRCRRDLALERRVVEAKRLNLPAPAPAPAPYANPIATAWANIWPEDYGIPFHARKLERELQRLGLKVSPA